MYKPKHFTEDRVEILKEFIKTHPLALIISSATNLQANLIPINIYDEGELGTLRCHLAISNSQIEELQKTDEVLVVFMGAQSYISPELYETKKIHGKVVPTWNFSMVQVRGKPTIIKDTDWLLKQVNDLTNQLEKNKENKWQVSDAPADHIQTQLRGIIGVEIPIKSIEGKFKTSQNQPEENRVNIEKHFRENGDTEMADYVRDGGFPK